MRETRNLFGLDWVLPGVSPSGVSGGCKLLCSQRLAGSSKLTHRRCLCHLSAAVLQEEPGDLGCSAVSTPDMFACCLRAVYLSVNFGQASLCGMLRTDGFCFYLLGPGGKMLTELCFQEPASSLLTHAALRSVRVGTPLSAPSETLNCGGFCAREEGRTIPECSCSPLSVAVGTASYFQTWGGSKQSLAPESSARSPGGALAAGDPAEARPWLPIRGGLP